jgi:AcrR family transcriptional regulator
VSFHESSPWVRLTRAQQQAATRERLLAAAEQVIAREGFGGASIDLIALEAGFSKGAIYSNFKSKEEVFLELLRVYMERDMASLESLLRLAPEQLNGAVTEWLENMHTQWDCPALVTELQLHARRSPEFAGLYYTLQERQIQMLASILKRYFKALSKDIPIDAKDLAGALIALAQGLSLQRPLPKAGKPGSAARVINAMLKLFTA